MKTIKSDLNIGKTRSGLDLFCDISLDNKHLKRMKCESFVGNLMKVIRLQMGGTATAEFYKEGARNGDNISSIFIGEQDVTINLGNTSLDWNYDGTSMDAISIQGVRGLDGLNGVYWREDGKGDFDLSYNRYNYTIKGIAPYLTGQWDGESGVGEGMRIRTFYPDGYQMSPMAWHPEIGFDNRPVKASDLIIPGQFVRGNNRGNVSASSLITDQQSSKFTLSRPFTNESGELIQIAEFGLVSQNYNQRMLMSRDVFEAPLNLDHGKTLSLDYEVVSSIENFNQDTDTYGSNGGWTENFMYCIRRLGHPDSTFNWGTEWNFVAGLGGGGCGVSYNQKRNIQAWKFGVRLGTNNKFVSMTDQTLNPDDETDHGIVHGYEDGQLVHHGTLIGEVVVDDDTNEATFPIERIFENRGAASITVKEIGMFGNRYNSSSMTPSLLARRALSSDDQFTIQPGQSVKVGFNCKAVV